MIDSRRVPENSYILDERIIGDFYDLGWVVVRGVRIGRNIDDAIYDVAKTGHPAEGIWFSIESQA